MNKKYFLRRIATISIPLLVIIIVFTVALNIVANYYSLTMNYIFGEGGIIIDKADGTENLGAEYYTKTYNNPEEASAQMKKLNRAVAEEGIVLLKNENNALPLNASERRLSVFGWAFENSPYCAPQSGSSSSAGDYLYPADALMEAGFVINEELSGLIKEGVPEYMQSPPKVGRWTNDWALPEYVPSTEQVRDAASWSDTALIWIMRQGTEGADMPQSMNDNAFYGNEKMVGLSEDARRKYGYAPERHSLELTSAEELMIEKVCSAGFKKIILVVNSDNPMELGFIKENEAIDAALLVGGLGMQGFSALPDILTGKVNPSGRLADIYPADFTSDPVYPNHADLTGGEYVRDSAELSADTHLSNSVYVNITPQSIAENNLRTNGDAMQYVFQNYEEGIYSGYRYYETRALNEGENWYHNAVVYPFGYGLSYTTFKQYISGYEVTDSSINVRVCVKNTGDVPGKCVVQLYYTAPYGKESEYEYAIEKSAVVLADFSKTGILQPGEECVEELKIDIEDMASYDDKYSGCYVLDGGKYRISLRLNSHETVFCRDDAAAVCGEQIIEWNNPKTILFDENNPRKSEKYAHNDEGLLYRSSTNAFDVTLTGISPSFSQLSRADWAGTFPQVPDEADKTAPNELIELFKNYDIGSMNNDDDEMPFMGKDNGLQLIDLRGTQYGDSIWQTYLDQWTVDQMLEVVSKNGRGICGITELGLPASINSDGSMGIKYKSIDYVTYGIRLPLCCTAPVMAKTWNKMLAYKFGEICGEEALQYGMNGWYAPALNLHRSPFAGRYYDYFSEDPFLTGTFGTAICSGAGSKGLNVYLKHFVLNEGEYLRNYCSVWASEQTMRELYLKPFEMCIKNSVKIVRYYDKAGEMKQKTVSAVQGIMSSFNRVGSTWAGGNKELLNDVLREEWGFNGVVITDNMREQWADMNPDVMIRSGGNVCMSGGKQFADTSSATAVKALRQAVHGICYAVVNSNAMNKIPPGSFISYSLAPWQTALIIIDFAVGAVTIGAVATFFILLRKYNNSPHAG